MEFSLKLEPQLFVLSTIKSITVSPSVTFTNQQLWHIQGPNGQGKTTYLRWILTESQKKGVATSYLPHDLGLLPYESLATHEKFFQHLYGESFSPSNHKLWPKVPSSRRIIQLSRGQQQAVALSLRLAPNIPFWILDEPWTALDHEAANFLELVLKHHCEQGGCVVFTSHDRQLNNAMPLRLESNAVCLQN